jgi:general secretion pathway protein I
MMRARRNAGFTLLEALVATAIMGIAVTALLSNMSASMRNASKLTEHDRAAAIAHARMDELLLDMNLPHGVPLHGNFDPRITGWRESGWSATVTPFDRPPHTAAGSPMLERIGLEIWWVSDGVRRTFQLEAFRSGFVRQEDGP